MNLQGFFNAVFLSLPLKKKWSQRAESRIRQTMSITSTGDSRQDPPAIEARNSSRFVNFAPQVEKYQPLIDDEEIDYLNELDAEAEAYEDEQRRSRRARRSTSGPRRSSNSGARKSMTDTVVDDYE